VPLPEAGVDPFAGSVPQRWPHIIFQVFWYPLLHEKERKDAVVLLGEAVAPPLATLGAAASSYRLPLNQVSRRVPRNAASYENWLQRDFKVQQAQADNAAGQQAEEKARREAAETEWSARCRDLELLKLQSDFEREFFKSPMPDLGQTSSPCPMPDLLAEIYGRPPLFVAEIYGSPTRSREIYGSPKSTAARDIEGAGSTPTKTPPSSTAFGWATPSTMDTARTMSPSPRPTSSTLDTTRGMSPSPRATCPSDVTPPPSPPIPGQ